MTACEQPQALSGVRVVDLSRILAGPVCTQLLGDLGADVVKIERPFEGDDTRNWGPAYPMGKDGVTLSESAYFCAANRNKRSIAIDIAADEGQRLIRRLLKEADVLVENFKVGTLSKYGLSYEDLREEFPRLIYCSITGFGQDGPYASRSGYDYIAQALGGLMSITGEPAGEAMKVGVGVADIMCGMYATAGILAALFFRERSGEGQHIDCALLDTQIASLANVGVSYLTSRSTPERLGNDHPNIVPYRVFSAADGDIVLAIGNDAQFKTWCTYVGAPELAGDADFATNLARVRNRDAVNAKVAAVMRTRTAWEWEESLNALGIPCSRVNNIEQVFGDEHVNHRGMHLRMPSERTASGSLSLIANPLKMSRTPPVYSRQPPMLGEHSVHEVELEWQSRG